MEMRKAGEPRSGRALDAMISATMRIHSRTFQRGSFSGSMENTTEIDGGRMTN